MSHPWIGILEHWKDFQGLMQDRLSYVIRINIKPNRNFLKSIVCSIFENNIPAHYKRNFPKFQFLDIFEE